jgi:hypothetical protein
MNSPNSNRLLLPREQIGPGKQEKANRSLRLESGENTPLPIGFPRGDVFRYEGKKPLRSINWAKMKRWQ